MYGSKWCGDAAVSAWGEGYDRCGHWNGNSVCGVVRIICNAGAWRRRYQAAQCGRDIRWNGYWFGAALHLHLCRRDSGFEVDLGCAFEPEEGMHRMGKTIWYSRTMGEACRSENSYKDAYVSPDCVWVCDIYDRGLT